MVNYKEDGYVMDTQKPTSSRITETGATEQTIQLLY